MIGAPYFCRVLFLNDTLFSVSVSLSLCVCALYCFSAGLDEISFLDYLTYLPLFSSVHSEVMANPLRMSIAEDGWFGGAL